jgi:nitrous oxidase accessory protein
MLRAAFYLVTILSVAACRAGAEQEPGPRPVSVVQRMIDEAGAGAAIRVPAGVYQGNLIIRKPVVIDGGGLAIFDGLGEGTVITIAAEGVTVRGCTVRASGQDVSTEPAAIFVGAGGATIESNTIEDALFGIDLRDAPGSAVRGNTVRGKPLDPERRGDGIRVWSSHGTVVEDNVVHDARDMVFWYSEDLQVARNTVTGSRYGLHFMYSHRITLRSNQLRNNRGASGYGIGLKDCDDIAIVGNALLANRVGVYIDNSPSSFDSLGLFESNMIALNEVGLLATPNTHNNVFTGNAFIENEEPAATHGRGRLVSNSFSREGVGNYWSDDAGFDLDGDGIGDLKYEPRSLFGAMLANDPNLRLFVHSPAQQAIEFTSRALPEIRPESTLADPHPLALAPRITLARPTLRPPGMGWPGSRPRW